MPAKSKNKPAHQHEERHDAALAAPAKRLSKDRTATISKVQTVRQVPLPSTGLNHGLTFPRPTGNAAAGLSGQTEQFQAAQDAPPSSFERSGSQSVTRTVVVNPEHNLQTATLLRSDRSMARDLGAQISSTFGLATTILTSCPLCDAIAILILLLSLPPTLVITVQTLFASLNFVPPTASLSLAASWTLPSVSDWFTATASGGPSPFTIILLDVLISTLYLVFPYYMQHALMDIAHAVVAISLSGASAGKTGPTDSIAFCTFVAFMLHIYRRDTINVFISQYSDYLGFDVGMNATKNLDNGFAASSTHGWPRILLACHILAQGVHALLRRLLAGSSRPRMNTRSDSEPATPIENIKTGFNASIATNMTNSSNGDAALTPISPTLRESKDKASNSRKRRKQANQVRSQQPLWAAIGSTKVTFLKELEQKQASTDAFEAGSMATSRTLLPILLQDSIHVRNITSTEFGISVDMVDLDASSQEEVALASIPDRTSTRPERHRPFIVRLNGADWASTLIEEAAQGEDSSEVGRTTWDGEIYGLTPLTKYTCDIVRATNQELIGSVNLITLPAPQTEHGTPLGTAVSAVSAHAVKVSAPSIGTPHQALRPLSPTSTLRQSIASAESKRDELRNKVKRIRKEHKNATTATRRELDQLNAKLSSSGGQDERQKQRMLQLRQTIKQVEDATSQLQDDLVAIGDIPADKLETHALRKRAWETVHESKTRAMQELNHAKSQNDREVSQYAAELANLTQKRDRFNARRSKLSEQIEKMVNQQSADLSARQRREEERAAMSVERANAESKMIYWINETRLQTKSLNVRANEYLQQADLLRSMMQRQQQPQAGPLFLEGVLSTTPGFPSRDRSLESDMTKPLSFVNGESRDQIGKHGAQRSSSAILSGFNGFADEFNATAFGRTETKDRNNNHSSTGSTNSVVDRPGSQPGSGRVMRPIGGSTADEKDRGSARPSPVGSLH